MVLEELDSFIQDHLQEQGCRNGADLFVVDADAVNEDGFIADSHAVSTIKDSNCIAMI